MKEFDVAIVGGGAAGMACAAALAKLDPSLAVVIVEGNARLGKKLAATGNGQGNVTNSDMRAEKYFTQNSLVKSIALTDEAKEIEKKLFHCVLTCDSSGRVYPGGKQASALTDSLLGDLKRGKVTVFTGVKVTAISRGFTLALSDGNEISAKRVVLATGGKAQKQFGTDGSSYALAEKFGHSLTALYPSLVQLKTDTAYIKNLRGIRVDCLVTALSGGKVIAQKRGDVIFTDYGVSGNAIFEISPYVTDKQGVTLSLSFLPDDNGEVAADVKKKKALGYERDELLSGTLHNQLGRAIMRRCASEDETAIQNAVKNFTLKVVGTLGFDYAQVTKGGVKLDEVTPELESKFVKNLFFAGEILDVDGECGGYNLHWAFASAARVAKALAGRYD